MRVQNVIEKPWRIAEIGALEASDSLVDGDQTRSRSSINHADRADRFEPFSRSRGRCRSMRVAMT